MKDANNKAFGANMQRIKGRNKLMVNYDKSSIMEKCIEVKLVMPQNFESKERIQREKNKEDLGSQMINPVKQSRKRKLLQVVSSDEEEPMSSFDIHMCKVRRSYKEETSSKILSKLKKRNISQVQTLQTGESITHNVTEKNRNIKVANNRFVGGHI